MTESVQQFALTSCPGLSLEPTAHEKICSVCVEDEGGASLLSWDRYVRLKAAGDKLSFLAGGQRPFSLLDIGGFDGALAFFLKDMAVQLIDPATTGGTGLTIDVADRSYDAVTAIDVIEHIPPESRIDLIDTIARIARSFCIVSFPSPKTIEAQQFVFKMTGNPLVKEHVEYGLPDPDWVKEELVHRGFAVEIVPNASCALWVAQYCVTNLRQDKAQEVNRFLIANFPDEPASQHLYEMLVATRRNF